MYVGYREQCKGIRDIKKFLDCLLCVYHVQSAVAQNLHKGRLIRAALMHA